MSHPAFRNSFNSFNLSIFTFLGCNICTGESASFTEQRTIFITEPPRQVTLFPKFQYNPTTDLPIIVLGRRYSYISKTKNNLLPQQRTLIHTITIVFFRIRLCGSRHLKICFSKKVLAARLTIDAASANLKQWLSSVWGISGTPGVIPTSMRGVHTRSLDFGTLLLRGKDETYNWTNEQPRQKNHMTDVINRRVDDIPTWNRKKAKGDKCVSKKLQREPLSDEETNKRRQAVPQPQNL